MRYVIVLLGILFLAAGCASKNDVGIVEKHYGAYNTHQKEQTKQVQGKAKAIQTIMVFDCNDDSAACGAARALSKAMAAEKIASIAPQEFDEEMPLTGLDVQKDAVGYLGQNIFELMWGVVEVKRSNESGDEINVSTEGDVNYTQENNRATSIGESNSTSTDVSRDVESHNSLPTYD